MCHLSFSRICRHKRKFLRLTGVTLDQFLEIVRRIRPDWLRLQERKKSAGRNSHLASLEDEVLLVLRYYRYYTTHEFLGYTTPISAGI
jgi:hypothetical protein